MAATPATAFFDNMVLLTGNVGGAINQFPKASFVYGKERPFVSALTLASQASGTVFGVARIPLPFVLLGIIAITDTSLGSSTIKFGNAGNGNSAIYAAAATFTAANAPTNWALASTWGTEIVSGFDSVTGLATTYDKTSGYGGDYEDIIMTTGAAALPASGTLRVVVKFAIE